MRTGGVELEKFWAVGFLFLTLIIFHLKDDLHSSVEDLRLLWNLASYQISLIITFLKNAQAFFVYFRPFKANNTNFTMWENVMSIQFMAPRLKPTTSYQISLIIIFFKWTDPGLFFIYFWSFQTNKTLFTANQSEKCHVHPVYGAGIQTQDLFSNQLYHYLFLNGKNPASFRLFLALCLISNHTHQNFAQIYYDKVIVGLKQLCIKSRYFGLRPALLTEQSSLPTSVWPDLAKLRPFGNILHVFGQFLKA